MTYVRSIGILRRDRAKAIVSKVLEQATCRVSVCLGLVVIRAIRAIRCQEKLEEELTKDYTDENGVLLTAVCTMANTLTEHLRAVP